MEQLDVTRYCTRINQTSNLIAHDW